MKKRTCPRAHGRHLQRSTPSNESLDGFAAVVGVWWALRRAEKGQRKMIEVCERVAQLDAASKRSEQSSTSEVRFGETDGASSSTSFPSHRQAADGDGLFKDVVLYALTLVLQPVLAVVLTLAALWGLWQGCCGCSCRERGGVHRRGCSVHDPIESLGRRTVH